MERSKINEIKNVCGQYDHECPKTCLVVMVSVLAHGMTPKVSEKNVSLL